MKTRIRIVVTAAMLVCTCFAVTPTLHLKTKNGSPREQQTKAAVERLAGRYDLEKYTVTPDIVVEQGAMAHSYPVLTMNCRFLGNDDLLLSQYVHEQGHWALSRDHRPDSPTARALFAQLKRMFPNMPTEYPAGGFDEAGTYFHIPVIMLEWQALEQLIGRERARNVMEWKRRDHYTAIYATVLEHREQVEKLLDEYKIQF